MRLKSLAWVPLALLLLSAQAGAAEKVSKETLESQGRKRTYYVLAPSSLKAPAPLVVLLHGSGHNGMSLLEKWKGLAEGEGFVLAAPDSSDPRGWRVPEDGPDFIRDVVEAVKRKYPVDPRRVYLFGHSAGAVFALSLSMMESEYFAASAVHAGSWRGQNDSAVMRYAKRKTPLAIFVGDRDEFFPLDSVRATEAALKGQGFEVRVTVIKGHTHWYYDVADGINRDAWDFLKGHDLGGEPAYKSYNIPGGNTDDFNAAVREINALRSKARESVRLFYAKEEELRAKDQAKEAAAVGALAREQSELLVAAAAALRESAERAERTGALKLPGNYAQYFALVAQADARRAEALDAMRQRAALLTGGEQSNDRTSKMNEAAVRAEKLQREADELEQKAERARQGP